MTASRDLHLRRSQWAALAARGVAFAAGLAMVPLVLGHLGKPVYGLWMLLASLVAWLQLADLGLSAASANALAEANGRADLPAASAVLATAGIAVTALSVLGAAAALLAAPGLPWARIAATDDASLLGLAPAAFSVLAVLFFLALPLQLAQVALGAFQRAWVAHGVLAGGAVLSLAGVAVAVAAALPLPAVIAASGAGQVLALLVLWACLRRQVRGLSAAPRQANRAALGRLLPSALPFLLFGVGALATNQLVPAVLAQVATLATVADYAVLLSLYTGIFSLGLALSQPYYPAIREAFERRDTPWIRGALQRLLRLRMGVTGALTLPLVIFGDALVAAWTGLSLERPLGLAGWAGFLACMVLASASSALSEVLAGLDDLWFQVILVAATAVTVIAGIVLLVPRLGVGGVFIAMAASTVLPILVCHGRLRRRLAHA